MMSISKPIFESLRASKRMNDAVVSNALTLNFASNPLPLKGTDLRWVLKLRSFFCTRSKEPPTFEVCAIKAPGFGENRKAGLQDLAVLNMGDVIMEELGMNLEKVEYDMLDASKKVCAIKAPGFGEIKKSGLQCRILLF